MDLFLSVVSWICQHWYMDLSKLLHGFLLVVTYMDLSLLFFLPFAKQTKLKFDQDFPARWSLCFELKVLTESVVSLAMFSRFFEHSSLSWFYSTWIRRRGRSKRDAVEVFLEAIKGRENYKKEVTAAEMGRVVRMGLRLSPKQTRHRRRVVKIQPATTYLQHDIDYKVRCISWDHQCKK